MSVSLTCPSCRRSGVYADNGPGRARTCPDCGGNFQVDTSGRPDRIPANGAAAPIPPDKTLTADALAFLDRLETHGLRMIEGTGLFLTQGLPHWFVRQTVNLGRVAVKAGRVLLVFGVWFALASWPLLLLAARPGWFPDGALPVLLALAYTALALAGSAWGLRYARRQGSRWWRRAPRPSRKVG